MQAIHLAGVMVEMRNEYENDAEVASHPATK
jgi:hypothetical protein